MTKVCRLCLTKLQRGSKYFNINAVESFTGFMPYRDQLTTCIPEMALDLIPNPVICNNCRTALKSSYVFKSRCLLVEKKVRQYVESRHTETELLNLDEIDTSTLPKPAKYESEYQRESPQKKPVPILPKVELQSQSASLLSNLLSLKKDVILPNPCEIEITNVNPGNLKKERDLELATAELLPRQYEEDDQGMLNCNRCDRKFKSVPVLHTHKTRMHEEDYICNFCNVSFKTLQCLRRHNQQCQKLRNVGTTSTVLTKRPHLPTKAKNHLKRWLFKHTDHPYPTDVEKQQLMKETNLSLLQVENWFINARRRILADLTKLKNMSGKPPRGRRKKQQRNPEEGELDDILDDEPEQFFEEEKDQKTSRLLEGLDELSTRSYSDEMKIYKEEDDNENGTIDIVFAQPENDMEGKADSEEDPLEDIPLTFIAKRIKMEVEIDET